MGARKRRSAAITHAISRELNSRSHRQRGETWGRATIANFFGFFSLFHLDLTRYQYADFHAMRHDFWDIDEDEYATSFQPRATDAAEGNIKQEDDPSLKPAGDLGYSGSTFFHTRDGKYLVKSLDRGFESEFFMDELFGPYINHMKSHPSSLLIRITDMLYAPRATVGSILGIQPRHYIIMENLLQGLGNSRASDEETKWETYDLKPEDYFFPERDVADGMLASDEVIDGLVDKFPDQVHVPSLVKQELIDILLEDTRFLARSNVVDYSLFFVRCPKAAVMDVSTTGTEAADPAAAALQSPSWRIGVPSEDGKWMYRAVLLDFLWAKHKLQPKTMTGLVGAFNFFFRKGPMSITTEPDEYQKRFMSMVELLLSRRRQRGQGNGSVSE